jgi:hypothetical protein
MRTTLTLDDDVVRTIRDEMKAGEGKTFKQSVNDLIRLGRYKKQEQQAASEPRKRFKVRAKHMGTYPHLNYDNIGELLEQIEGPFHR